MQRDEYIICINSVCLLGLSSLDHTSDPGDIASSLPLVGEPSPSPFHLFSFAHYIVIPYPDIIVLAPPLARQRPLSATDSAAAGYRRTYIRSQRPLLASGSPKWMPATTTPWGALGWSGACSEYHAPRVERHRTACAAYAFVFCVQCTG